MKEVYRQTPWYVEVSEDPKDGIDLVILEADELCSFVKSKTNRVWTWLVIDRNSRKILSCYCGNRKRESAQKLWDKLPKVCRDSAICYTDFWEAYEKVMGASHIYPEYKSLRIEV